MKKLVLFLLLSITLNSLYAQSGKVFNYSDSVFQVQSIHYIDLEFYYNGGRKVIKDSLSLIELENLSDFIKKQPTLYFDIEYHTDHRGSEAYNLKLSQLKVDNLVADLIYNYGIDSSRIRPVGFGESKPILDLKYLGQMNLQNKDQGFRESIYSINRRTLLRITQIK